MKKPPTKRLYALEDMIEFVIVLRRALVRYGWDVVTDATLRDGLARLADEHFDAVLIDLRLLDSDWRKTVEHLPEIIALARPARIVVATGIHPPPECPGVDVVLSKGTEGILSRVLQAIDPHCTQVA